MKALVDLVLAKRWRSVLLAGLTAPLLPVVAPAIIALETARRGLTAGALCGVAAVLGLLLVAAASASDTRLFTGAGLVSACSGLLLGWVSKRAGSLAFAYQAVLLLSMIAVAVVGFVGVDMQMLFQPAIEEIVRPLLQGNELSPEEIAFIERRSVPVLLAATIFTQLIGALLLAYWWMLLAAGQRRFGQEFRALKLGKVLGGLATAIVVLGLVFDAELVQNLTPLALLGFLLQGIAVFHAWAHAKRWHPGLVASMYLLLLLPALNFLIVVPLSIVGVVDNWFDLRAPVRPQT